MTNRLGVAAMLAGAAVALAGCASTTAETPAAPARSAAAAMTPGMVMPDGSTMGASGSMTPVAADEPSAAAAMICSDEVRSDLATVLKLKAVPAPTRRWADHVLTCTYRLPPGTLVLSVTESTSNAAALAHARSVRARLGNPPQVPGLTDLAFATTSGTVVLVKDNDTLRVDASRLPASFGSQQQKRNDFAYEIASDILGCWTEG